MKVLSWWWVIPIILMLAGWKIFLQLLGVRIVPEDKIGQVIKKFTLSGKKLPDGRFIALNGEAGYQADLLAPGGLYFGLWPWQYEVKYIDFEVIEEGMIGIVEAIDGKNRPDGRIIAQVVDCDSFQNARAFLEGGGQRGPQGGILSQGKWRINKLLFKVTPVQITKVEKGLIGIVEAIDGVPLSGGRVVAKQVECDTFQNAKAFMDNGGERGPQMSVIPEGSYQINPLLFKVNYSKLAVIPEGKIGVVEARDGKPLSGGRIIAKTVECNSFQDAKAFMDNGGERGPQMLVIPQGNYRINPFMFNVVLEDVMDIPDNKVGVVTTREGKSLTTGEIAGDEIEGHNLFQNPQAFVDGGGTKGLQVQVLLAGRYFINPRFATVEIVDMFEVPIASVGVVVAFVGKEGHDVTGDAFKHGNLVGKGEKGVWVNVLDPGKYAINPYTHKVRNVPTANVVLNWATGKNESHKLDANLSTITVRSSDGFTFNLDVSQIIHIPRNDAPKVIARFGSMEALVTQVLEPMIGNYFRNAAQGSDVIEFLIHRSERQAEAKAAISAALSEYNVGAVETLIGDITPPPELMKTLTDRKIAEQEKMTYEVQKDAQTNRQALEQATALADTQPEVVAAERKGAIAKFEANAAVERANGEGQARVINAKAQAEATVANAKAEAEATTVKGQAEATVIETIGKAEASKTLAIGEAEAKVTQQKIESMEAGNYATVRVAEALAGSGMKLVPDIIAGGDSGNNGGLVSVLLGNLVHDAMKKGETAAKPAV